MIPSSKRWRKKRCTLGGDAYTRVCRDVGVERGWGRLKDKGCCGRKALKKLPALFIIHPVSQDWIIPRKTTAEINNTAEGRSRSEDQGSHKPAMPFADYGRNTLKLHRYECTTSSTLFLTHIHTHPHIHTHRRWPLKYSTKTRSCRE